MALPAVGKSDRRCSPRTVGRRRFVGLADDQRVRSGPTPRTPWSAVGVGIGASVRPLPGRDIERQALSAEDKTTPPAPHDGRGRSRKGLIGVDSGASRTFSPTSACGVIQRRGQHGLRVAGRPTTRCLRGGERSAAAVAGPRLMANASARAAASCATVKATGAPKWGLATEPPPPPEHATSPRHSATATSGHANAWHRTSPLSGLQYEPLLHGDHTQPLRV